MKKKVASIFSGLFLLASTAVAGNSLSLEPPEYKPLKRMIGNGRVFVATEKITDYFYYLVYDVNKDCGWKEEYHGFGGRDLIEYRRMVFNDAGRPIWESEPTILIIDDDFDGYADRALIDNGSEKDGIYDEVLDLKNKKIKMDDFDYSLETVL